MAIPFPGVRAIAPLLRRPLGLFSDVDGTLAPIDPTPEEAAIPPAVREDLAALARQGVVVALLSGRRAEALRRWVGLEDLIYVGNHGLERWEGGQLHTAPEAERFRRLARAARRELSRLQMPGLIIEDKEYGLALHYRLSPRPEVARLAIVDAIAASPSCTHFLVMEGKMVVELRPAVAVDKGTAALELVRRRRLRSVLALGDDVTDAAMFRRLREAQDLAAVCVAVTGPETPGLVTSLAHYTVEGPEGAAALVHELVTAFPRERRPTGS